MSFSNDHQYDGDSDKFLAQFNAALPEQQQFGQNQIQQGKKEQQLRENRYQHEQGQQLHQNRYQPEQVQQLRQNR